MSHSVLILAAGLGTRMKSRKAKVLHEAAGQTLVEHVLDAAARVAPPDNTTVIVGHQAERVKTLLGPRGVHFALQTEQKGTGHAVAICREQSSREALTVILYGDCPLLKASTIARLVDLQSASVAAGTLITVDVENPHGYGRILRADDGTVAAIVEEKATTAEQKLIREINSGIYCLRSDLLWDSIGEITPNPASGEIYLTDLVEVLRAKGHTVDAMKLDDPSEILGINNRVELATADAILRARKAHDLMVSGVTIFQPETVRIDAQVEIGMDTVIHPFTQILGRTVIGEDCVIGAGSVIRDSQIAPNTKVAEYCFIGTSVVESGCQIGPFSRLRQDNHVGPGAHIGNWVELKKTRFGAGSKAMHLAYLGDSVIGAGVNIGAGTITCNYDGTHKHPTIIGDNAFVGSNSTLVAPVEVASESYIAAGSVITSSVPPLALGMGRSRQTNIEGWVEKKRNKA